MSKQLAAIYTFLPGAFVLRERKREKSKELFFGERSQKIENGLDSTQETDVIFFSGLGKCRKLNGFFFFFSQCMFLFPCYIADRVSMHLHWLNTHTERTLVTVYMCVNALTRSPERGRKSLRLHNNWVNRCNDKIDLATICQVWRRQLVCVWMRVNRYKSNDLPSVSSSD